MYLNDFKAFKNNLRAINEQSEKSLEDWYFGWENKSSGKGGDGGGAIAIVYNDNVEGGSKELAENFIDELAEKAKESDVAQLESQGAEALKHFKNAMDIRKKLDSGPLRKEDGWYYGKGAWRINSNKIDYLGLTPSWMSWEDDLQEDILEAYFPEVLKGEATKDVNKEEEKEIEKEVDDLLSTTGIKKEEDVYAMAEGWKCKHIKKIYEQEEFTLGPPIGTEDRSRVVTPSDLTEFIVDNYKMKHRSNMMIWGAPGIGKTEIVKQAADLLAKEIGKKIPVYVVTLAQMQPYDLNGIPLAFKKEGSPDFIMDLKERGQIHMDFAIPAWLPGEGEESEGILFFDEINRASLDVLAAALTLLLDRKAQKYNMPPGWRVIAAGNRAMDGPVKPFEGAVASRFLGGHYHLVPTVNDWIEWARSTKAFYMDIEGNVTPEYYIPEEFILFLKHSEKEGKDDISRFFDLEGKPIKTNFTQFYNFEKNKLTSSGEGVSVGFPTPRTWSIAWKNIYAVLFSKPEYRDKLPKDSDPKKKAIDTMPFILQNIKDTNKMEAILDAVVGKPASKAFINYVKVLKRHSDSKGTLNEKLANIFKDPNKPRPLVDIPPIKDPSELYSILGLVISTISSMGTSFGMKEFINWTKWVLDLVGKVSDGELAAHISEFAQLSEHTAKVMIEAARSIIEFKEKGTNKETAMAFKPFAEKFREVLGSFNI